MKHILSLLLVLFLIACQKEEPVETAEVPAERATTLCEKYVAHIRSPFVKTFQTKEICMDSVHLVLFRNPKPAPYQLYLQDLFSDIQSYSYAFRHNLIEFATVTSPKTRKTDSLFSFNIEMTRFDFSSLSMPRFGKETDNIDIPYDSIPPFYNSYENTKVDIFKKSATELYIQYGFNLDIYSTETGKLRPKINEFKRETIYRFRCHNPTPSFGRHVFYTDSSILIKANPKMHSNYLEYFFEGDSLHMALQPDYCLVMAFYWDNGERQVYSNKNCTPEMLKAPRSVFRRAEPRDCTTIFFQRYTR